MASGDEVINHITTINDDGKLRSIEPFDRELGNTVYVPIPLCIATTRCLKQVEEAFLAATSREHFKTLLSQANIVPPQAGNDAIVLSLNFNTKIINLL